MYPIDRQNVTRPGVAFQAPPRTLRTPGSRAGSSRAPGGTPVVLLGDEGVLSLVHRALAAWAVDAGAGGPPVVVLDGGGCLDVYRIALEARRRGLEPGELLERIQVCRAFTGYQVVRGLLNLRRRFAPGHRMLLLNPLPPLLDPDLPEADRPWLFRRMLDGLDCLAREGYTVRVCQRSVRRPLPAGIRSRSGPPGHRVSTGFAAQAEAFETTLARRFPLLVAARGRIVGAVHGQERDPLLPGGGSGGDGLRRFPPLSGQGGPGALRPAV